jgi:hypothetical protein
MSTTDEPRNHPTTPHPGGWPPGLGVSLARVWREAELAEGRLPAWARPTGPESRLPVVAAVLVAIGLQLLLPDRYGIGPRWLIPALEVVLLVWLTVLNPVRLVRATTAGRVASFALVAAVTADNMFAAGVLAYDILTGRASGDATGLLAAGAAIYLTNIIAFGIWYWDLDRGGPFARTEGAPGHYPDFLFPQMTAPDLAPPHWEPRFLDYLYVAFTNVVAFSPTDTMPLSRWAKVLMSAQSAVALTTTVLVIARAVNVLK